MTTEIKPELISFEGNLSCENWSYHHVNDSSNILVWLTPETIRNVEIRNVFVGVFTPEESHDN
jgi:hypothetical protein